MISLNIRVEVDGMRSNTATMHAELEIDYVVRTKRGTLYFDHNVMTGAYSASTLPKTASGAHLHVPIDPYTAISLGLAKPEDFEIPDNVKAALLLFENTPRSNA